MTGKNTDTIIQRFISFVIRLMLGSGRPILEFSLGDTAESNCESAMCLRVAGLPDGSMISVSSIGRINGTEMMLVVLTLPITSFAEG